MNLTRSCSSVLLVSALAAFGCESKKPDGASPTPATTSAPDATTAAAKPTSAPAAEKKSYPAPSDFNLVPMAVGQWIRLVVKTDGQPPAQTFIRIVGKEGDAFWCEIEQNTPTGTTVIQFLMDEAARNDFKPNSIKKLKLRVNTGPVQELSGVALAASGALTEKYIRMIGKPNLDKAARSDASVNAGEFKGCYQHEYDESILGVTMKIKSWNHPAVPINGLVRSEGTANGKNTTTELYEMHLEGAKSVLP